LQDGFDKVNNKNQEPNKKTNKRQRKQNRKKSRFCKRRFFFIALIGIPHYLVAGRQQRELFFAITYQKNRHTFNYHNSFVLLILLHSAGNAQRPVDKMASPGKI